MVHSTFFWWQHREIDPSPMNLAGQKRRIKRTKLPETYFHCCVFFIRNPKLFHLFPLGRNWLDLLAKHSSKKPEQSETSNKSENLRRFLFWFVSCLKNFFLVFRIDVLLNFWNSKEYKPQIIIFRIGSSKSRKRHLWKVWWFGDVLRIIVNLQIFQ